MQGSHPLRWRPFTQNCPSWEVPFSYSELSSTLSGPEEERNRVKSCGTFKAWHQAVEEFGDNCYVRKARHGDRRKKFFESRW